MRKILYLALAGLALTGCKSGINVAANFSDFKKGVKQTTALLYIEVPTCVDKSTKLESTALLKTKQNIQFAIPESKFLQCNKEGNDSFAFFEVPLQVGKTNDTVEKGIGLAKTDKDFVFVSMSKDLKARIEKIKPAGYDTSSFKIRVMLTNDSGKEAFVTVPSAYVWLDDPSQAYPAHNGGINHPKDATVTFELSNVAASALFSERWCAAVKLPKE